jgi:hypothetical protein
MRRMKSTLVCACFLSAVLANAQTMVDRTYAMRAETTVFDPYSGMTHTCLLVLADGNYRLERSFQGMSNNNVDNKVYLDSLPEASMKKLEAVLNDSNFQAIKTGEPAGGIVPNMDTLMVSVPREHSVQNIYFLNADQRRPFDKQLKPFQVWFKEVQKRKLQVNKQEAANNCKTPMVMYRSENRPDSADSQ